MAAKCDHCGSVPDALTRLLQVVDTPDDYAPSKARGCTHCGSVPGAAARLLERIGDRGVCRSCNAAVFWVKTKRGKRSIYDADTGVSHFGTCPNAHQHRRKK